MIAFVRSRGTKGWMIYLVLRLPIFWRRFERQSVKRQGERPVAQAKS